MPENRKSSYTRSFDRARENGRRYGGEDDFHFEIVESFGIISTSAGGWSKELNRVSWNGKEAKFDLRDWSPDHEKMHRGVTFTEEEALELKDLLELALEKSHSGPLIDVCENEETEVNDRAESLSA